MIKNLTQEAEVGKIYMGTVRKIAEFGAFVEIFPGTDGLVHISELADKRVKSVTDVLKEGDEVLVKVISVDRAGKIRLSRKEALADAAGKTPEPTSRRSTRARIRTPSRQARRERAGRRAPAGRSRRASIRAVCSDGRSHGDRFVSPRRRPRPAAGAAALRDRRRRRLDLRADEPFVARRRASGGSCPPASPWRSRPATRARSAPLRPGRSATAWGW